MLAREDKQDNSKVEVQLVFWQVTLNKTHLDRLEEGWAHQGSMSRKLAKDLSGEERFPYPVYFGMQTQLVETPNYLWQVV